MAKQLHIAAHTVDLGPKNNLDLVLNAARIRGHRVTERMGNLIGATGIAELLSLEPDVVLTGLSSYKKQDEIGLGMMAERRGIKWVVSADVCRAWGRLEPRFAPVAHLLVPLSGEIKEAVAYGYRGDRTFFRGGPPMWESFWNLKPLAAHLSTMPIVGIGGIKGRPETDDFLREVIAGTRLALGDQFAVVFKTHPKEDGKPEEVSSGDWNRVRIEELRSTILRKVEVIEPDPKINSNVLWISIDYPFFTSWATGSIACVIQRHWGGYWENAAIRARAKEQSGFGGWYPAEKGTLVTVRNSAEVTGAIRDAQREEVQRRILNAQIAIFPESRPNQRSAADQVVDYLEEVAV